MLLLREYDFTWRKPDPRRPDVVAYFEVPQDINYVLAQGTDWKVLVPAKASIVIADDDTISSNSDDVSNASVDGANNEITFKLPHFELGSFYNVNELVQIVEVTGADSYEEVSYTSGTPSAGEWTYDEDNKQFTVKLDDVTGATIYIYYVPKGGMVKLVHKISGAVKSEITLSTTSTNQHVIYDPTRMPPRVQKTEFCGSRTFIEIHVYPRTISGDYKYEFDPLLPDNDTSDVCLLELPVQRA